MNISDLQGKALELLDGDYLGVIPKTNTFFYPETFVENGLTDLFKKIDSIKIKRSGLSGIRLNIVERIPTALVCGGFHNEEGLDQKCYSVDKDGYVFEESPLYSEGVYPHYYVSLDEEKDIIGTYFIDTKLFSQLQKFISYIKDSKISTVGILISEKDEYELYIKNKDLSEAVVYFDNKVPFDKTASNLVAFWNDSVLKKKGTSTPPVFDYINLRFGNNIFYVTK